MSEAAKRNGDDRNSLPAASSSAAGKKVIIKSADMKDDLQTVAINIAIDAFEKHGVEKDVAEYIKKEFDKKHGPTWHCIVGKNFVSSRQAIERRRKKAEAQQAGSSSKDIPEAETENPEIPEQTSEQSPPHASEEREEDQPLGNLQQRKRIRSNEGIVRTYVPQWGVLSTDALASSAPPNAREIGPDLCRGLILPADRPTYDKVKTVDACTEMLGLLSMAVPWAAVVTDRVQSSEVRVAKAEEGLRTCSAELERVSGQATALMEDRDALRKQVDELKARVARRNGQLKATQKAVRKNKKILLDLTEDRCFQMGYDEAVMKAHSSGLDHTLLLEDGMSNPVGREEVDEPLTVSSGEDEDLSE